MSDDDLRALVNSLPDVSTDDLTDIIANFSTDFLAKASAAIAKKTAAATATTAEEQQQQQLGFNGVVLVNNTLEKQCLLLQQQQQQPIRQLQQLTNVDLPYAVAKVNGQASSNVNLSCPSSFDSVLCWPHTQAGTWAVLPCFEEFKGVHYDTTDNATRYCHANGTWSSYSNYDKCHQTGPQFVIPDFAASIELPVIIYSIGYFLSFVALVLALIVFISFKDLKCLRNTIHANLFITYITSAMIWILILFLQLIIEEASLAGCITLVILLQYFYLTNFFWMFVEGLYLYTLVVKTFSSDSIHFTTYLIIGWGCPALIILSWSIAKAFSVPLGSEHFNGLEIGCPWMSESHIDWIFKVPTSLVILLNLIFLIRIMWVLIMKLRSANTLETRQYYKASKALLVLIPLFGITYLLVLTGPEQGFGRYIFEVVRAFLLSTQGFFVAIFFCFLNSEVRQTLRHRVQRWRDDRSVPHNNSIRNRRYRFSKDYSQRSRTESLRTEEGVVCVRPNPHTWRNSLKRFQSVEKTDFV